MTRKSAISIVACFLAAALSVGVGSTAQASQEPAVTMTLQAVALTNDFWHTDYWHTAVFLVTNAGTRPALLESSGCSFVPTNFGLPLGLFGRCEVPPGANCTMRVTWRPYVPGPYWFRFAVFEPPSVFRRAKVTALGLGANLSGKAHLTSRWVSDLWSTNAWFPAYEITSPTVPRLPEPPFPLNSSLKAAEAEEPAPWSLGFEWFTDAVNSKEASLSAQQDGAANGSQPIRSETNRASSAAGSRR
jgi:hypothetical protein